jgi:hypothetical protein
MKDERAIVTSRKPRRVRGLVPLGRLGLYKYVTMDSTPSMVQRLVECLDGYLSADEANRFEIQREIRATGRTDAPTTSGCCGRGTGRTEPVA